MPNEELKACPCCGSGAEIKNTPQSDFIRREVRYWVRCNKQCIEQFETYETPRQAKEAWNHRQPDTELVKALEAVLDAGDEGCCEECMDKDAIAKQALAKYRSKE